MTEDNVSRDQGGYGLDRILALSDGVFAFAVTLLVIDLVVPTLSAGASSGDLWEALSNERVSFLSYLLSFLIAGLWWNAHNRNFRQIRRSDSTLSWLNLLFLLWIALLPFFTKILDQYIDLQIAVVLYATDQAAAGIFLGFSWWYASRNHRLVDKDLKQKAIKSRTLANAVAPLFFIVSIGLSFISPTVATYSWYAMFPVLAVTHRLQRKSEKQ
jgi:uncharacterized membrane protein